MKDLDPVISIVMPVYHPNDHFLIEAIESIINQTYKNFEFIIISDDTLDQTKTILDYYQNADKRIRVYPQQREGLISSLNRGIRLSKGIYIARMDADDISHPERFEKQFDFLERHHDIGVCGTWMEFINADGNLIEKSKTPLSHNLIEWDLFFGCSMSHPTIMMRKKVIENYGYYNIEGEFAEDYDLWARLIFFTKFANLPIYLVKYRLHDNNVSAINIKSAWQTNKKTRFSLLKHFFLMIPIKPDFTFIESDLWGTPMINDSQVEKQLFLLQTLYKLYLNNRILSISEKKQISQDFSNRIRDVSKTILYYGLHSLKFYNLNGMKYCIIALYLSPQTIIKEIVVISINVSVSVLKKINKLLKRESRLNQNHSD